MRNRKNKVLIIFIVNLSLLMVTPRCSPKYISQLKDQFGVTIKKKDVALIKQEEKWDLNGDGFYWADIKIRPGFDIDAFFNAYEFRELPISEDIPVGEKYSYLSTVNKGKYLFKADSNDVRDFRILLFDDEREVLFFYYQFY